MNNEKGEQITDAELVKIFANKLDKAEKELDDYREICKLQKQLINMTTTPISRITEYNKLKDRIHDIEVYIHYIN